jgi:hypothetical protein
MKFLMVIVLAAAVGEPDPVVEDDFGADELELEPHPAATNAIVRATAHRAIRRRG